MGKKGKIGKQRKDKFYHLAKETGFRSRAAFKLLQLNRKYEFLQKCRVLIDLCAAPGGWLQVAQKHMPVSSVIVGVDLVPIKPIHNIITIQEDITTERCRQALKKELKTWKADIVLHDGAPNIGTAWVHDAYAQAQLTLSALKLATQFLTKGGWFITKVFRSSDYLALLWVLQKLFKKVHATKPQASRHESAEIFLVCRSYISPDKIDPKFLDPGHLFKPVEVETKGPTNLFNLDSQKKPKAEGYPEGDYTLYHPLEVSKFVSQTNHVELLAGCSELVFDNEEIANHPLTTTEIKECCKDIKVLGKRELRLLLNWRKAVKEQLEPHNKQKTIEEVKVEEDEEEQLLRQQEEMLADQMQQAKRKKKQVQKGRKKLRDRMNLQMILKNDVPLVEQDEELFRLGRITSDEALKAVTDESAAIGSLDAAAPEEEEKEEDGVDLRQRKWAKYDREEKPQQWDDHDQQSGDASDSEVDEEDASTISSKDGEDDEEDSKSNPLIVDLDDKEAVRRQKIANWFQKDAFASIGGEKDENLELELMAENFQKRGGILIAKDSTVRSEDTKETETSTHSNVSKNQNVKINKTKDTAVKRKNKLEKPATHRGNAVTGNSSIGTKQTSVLDAEDDETNTPVTNLQPDSPRTPENAADKPKKKKKIRLDPEGMALGSLMVQSQKMKRDILDNAYNRNTFNDENLPDWFLKDEEKHNKQHLPVTSEMVAEYRARLKEINARPIKKVVEAKARKKKRALRRLEKARKRAEALTESADMTDKEKNEQVKSVYKKALRGQRDKEVTYVVATKGTGKRVRRPPGVKGRFRVVDRRLKKDKRAMQSKSVVRKGKKGRRRR